MDITLHVFRSPYRFPIMKLPREIRYQIFELLFEQHGSLTRESLNSVNLFGVDPSIRQPLHRLFSGYVDELGPLLYFDDIQEYQNEVKDFLGYKCHFIIPRVEWLYKMPKAFGRNNCEMIRHLTIRMEDCVQYKHERMWPASLELLTDGFLYLRYFEMYTETPEIATPYPECGDDVDLTVSQKCLRSLLRFIAFAVLRHNNQDRAIFPANSTDQSLIPSYIIHRVFAEKARAFNPGGPLKKWNSMQDSNTSQVREDQILNTTTIRETTWNKLALIDVPSFFLHPQDGRVKDEIVSSETQHSTDQFDCVDHFGYLKKKKLRSLGVPYRAVDHWIEIASQREKRICQDD